MRQTSFLDCLYRSVADIPGLVVRAKFQGAQEHWDDMEQAAAMAMWQNLSRSQSRRGDIRALCWTVAYAACCVYLRRVRTAERHDEIARSTAETVAQGGFTWPSSLLRRVPRDDRKIVIRALLMEQTLSEIQASAKTRPMASKRKLGQRIRRGVDAMRAAIEGEAA